MFKRILCPVDFDSNSLEALRVARELAIREQGTIQVLHVTQPIDPTVTSAPSIGQRSQEHVWRELRQIADKELTGVDHEVILRTGQPAKEILKAENEVEAELVVMATHGRTGMSHLVLGSVTEKVVRESSCAVLTIRMKPGLRSTNRV
jgi:universal stress protein A